MYAPMGALSQDRHVSPSVQVNPFKCNLGGEGGRGGGGGGGGGGGEGTITFKPGIVAVGINMQWL